MQVFLRGTQLKVCGAINKEIGDFLFLCHNDAVLQLLRKLKIVRIYHFLAFSD